jgi:shikimate dehydrogenase
MGVPYAEVIGDPVAHSRSPLIHKFWLQQLGIEGDYRATRVTDDGLSAYLEARIADPDWRGCNVTMPHKQNAVLLLDAIADEDIGAVNCVIPEAGRLVGRNTDAPGFLAALAEVPPLPLPENHRATFLHLVGAGGAARAVAAAWRGGDIQYFNRTSAKAAALADEFGPGSDYGYGLGLDALNGPSLRQVDQRDSYIAVNASSMGMEGQPPMPIDLSLYPDDTIVCDLVYHPLETLLLREARRLGMRTIDGLSILIAQARLAFEYFFGMPPPRGDAELRQRLTS